MINFHTVDDKRVWNWGNIIHYKFYPITSKTQFNKDKFYKFPFNTVVLLFLPLRALLIEWGVSKAIIELSKMSFLGTKAFWLSKITSCNILQPIDVTLSNYFEKNIA